MARAKRDITAEFYDAFEEMGEYCDFYIGRYRPGMSAPEWTRFRHQEHDGASALAQLLRKHANVHVDIETSPNPPSRWTLFVAFLKLLILAFRPRPPMRWRRFDKSWRPNPDAPAKPTAVAWSLFSRDETLRLGELATSHGVSMQSWLLWALKEAMLPELLPNTGVTAWHVPVTMHGAFGSKVNAGNGNFSLEVVFPPDADPPLVHRTIRQELRSRRHWVIAKAVHSFTWLLPPWLFRKLMLLAEHAPPWQGSFSNSGAVSPDTVDAANDSDEWFIGLNPVVKPSPLGVCCSEWCGRLALSVQIHPALASDPQVAREWMAAWRRIAEGGRTSLAAIGSGAPEGALPAPPVDDPSHARA